ncbi:MAG: tRNA pseudouridine(38-40) synthase TruA [Bacteroidetes bacterium]|nr:tRNA pseudouridine(38-40) synthase TruA [Bacteroidota bacterium]
MTRTIKLTIEYDGTEFVGWQRQPNGRTVQQEIERALQTITREDSGIVGAGRTDSGVHARGQVASFKTDSGLSPNDLKRALNGNIPNDIVIRDAEVVDDEFSARYSAVSREYRYYINTVPTAIDRNFCWECAYQMDIGTMNRIAASIIGIHDFQSFCKSDSEVEHYRCEVFESDWSIDGTKMIYHVRANRFLQGMVRALVGTMVNIGRGHTQESEFSSIMVAKNRSKAGQAAPAKGLFLERVTY